mgnify:CR=1 FL=1
MRGPAANAPEGPAKFRIAAQVGEGLDDQARPDRIGLRTGRSNGAGSPYACRVVLMLECRDVGTLGDVDADGIVLSCHQVIAFNGSPKLVGLDADDWNGRLVEIFPPAEHFGRDRVTLDFTRSTGQRLFDHVFQKRLLSIRRVELRRILNSLELLANIRRREIRDIRRDL